MESAHNRKGVHCFVFARQSKDNVIVCNRVCTCLATGIVADTLETSFSPCDLGLDVGHALQLGWPPSCRIQPSCTPLEFLGKGLIVD